MLMLMCDVRWCSKPVKPKPKPTDKGVRQQPAVAWPALDLSKESCKEQGARSSIVAFFNQRNHAS
jgi:hypothetical protein